AFSDVDRVVVTAAHRTGLHVHPYTVNEEADMRRMIEARVDGMFTNFTDRLLRLRPDNELRGLEAVRRAAVAARRGAPLHCCDLGALRGATTAGATACILNPRRSVK